MENFDCKISEVSEVPNIPNNHPDLGENLENEIDDILGECKKIPEQKPDIDVPDKPWDIEPHHIENTGNDSLEDMVDDVLEGEYDSVDNSAESDGVNKVEEDSATDSYAEDGANGNQVEKPSSEAEQETYKTGGSYKEVKEHSNGETHEVHHMPSDDASSLERNEGPCIKMEKEDHRKTASYGNSREAREYRAKQRELIEQGKFKEAQQMDIDDIREKFGDKYDEEIKQMEEYTKKLEEEGRI